MDPQSSGTPGNTAQSDTPPSEDAAIWAYRLLLGREPENAEIVRDHVAQSASLEELRERFLSSPEFTQHYRPVTIEYGRSVSFFPPSPVQTTVDPATRTRLFDHVRASWQRLGETEPYWSVLSAPEFKMARIPETREAFLDSGQENVKRLFATLRRNRIEANPAWTVLELGCGLGRATRWLARDFREVIGVDISKSHLRLAEQINAEAQNANRIRWLHLADPATLGTLPEFDLFFSLIVLQHNPPPLIGMILEKIAEKLRPGGVAFFQVPTYQLNYSFDVENYLRLRGHTLDVEMHAFPQEEVFRIFEQRGCVPLEVFEDDLSGDRNNRRSNSFLFRKLSASDIAGNAYSGEWVRRQLQDAADNLEQARKALAREREDARMQLDRAHEEARLELDRVHEAARREYQLGQTALANAAAYAATLEDRCQAQQAHLDRIVKRFGWLRFLLPARHSGAR